MEYFTTPEQESRLHREYQQRLDQEQDRLRMIRARSTCVSLSPPPFPSHPDRLFFVEPDGHMYLGEIKPENECPHHPIAGGAYYGVDDLFLREVQSFTARHSRYVVIFQMRKGYSSRAGIYPARMVCDTEELILEDVQEDLHLS